MSDFTSPSDRAYLNGYKGLPAQGYTSGVEYEAHREGQLARAADDFLSSRHMSPTRMERGLFLTRIG